MASQWPRVTGLIVWKSPKGSACKQSVSAPRHQNGTKSGQPQGTPHAATDDCGARDCAKLFGSWSDQRVLAHPGEKKALTSVVILSNCIKPHQLPESTNTKEAAIMFDYSNFGDVFPAGLHNPYDRKLQHDVEAHRKHVDGTLFIDRVLKALGISKGELQGCKRDSRQNCINQTCVPYLAKVYPPKTDNAIRQLHQQICEAGMSTHHKFSLLYYVLLDFDDASKGIFASEEFARLSGMPANYQLFMKGLWYMDKQEYSVRPCEYASRNKVMGRLTHFSFTESFRVCHSSVAGS